MSLALTLKKLRQERGESLQAVADAIGISKAHVWELEAGKSKNPSADLLRKLSGHYQVSISTLVGESGSPEEEDLKVMFRQLREISESDRQIVQGLITSLKERAGK